MSSFCESRGFVSDREGTQEYRECSKRLRFERINVLVHSMSIIVNQSVHNSRSNLQENGYLEAPHLLICVNPSRYCEASDEASTSSCLCQTELRYHKRFRGPRNCVSCSSDSIGVECTWNAMSPPRNFA